MELTDFDAVSKTSAKHLHMRAMAVISELLETEPNITDAIRVYEATSKRLGLNQTERVDTLPSMSLVINGCSVQISAAPAPPPEALEVLEDITPDPTPVPSTAFNIDFSTLSPLEDL